VGHATFGNGELTVRVMQLWHVTSPEVSQYGMVKQELLLAEAAPLPVVVISSQWYVC